MAARAFKSRQGTRAQTEDVIRQRRAKRFPSARNSIETWIINFIIIDGIWRFVKEKWLTSAACGRGSAARNEKERIKATARTSRSILWYEKKWLTAAACRPREAKIRRDASAVATDVRKTTSASATASCPGGETARSSAAVPCHCREIEYAKDEGRR